MKTRSKEKKARLVPIPSQTVGPFFYIGLTGPHSTPRMAGPDAKGERVKLICTMLDGKGVAIPDGMIEIWQANAEGKYNHPADKQSKSIDPAFMGFGRAGTDANGACEFETIKPGRVPSRGKIPQAPHLEVSVFARGLLKRAATRIYFAGDPANDEDPVLALVPKARRATLIAQPDSSQPGRMALRYPPERGEGNSFLRYLINAWCAGQPRHGARERYMPARLIDSLGTTGPLADLFSDDSLLQAMLDFEVALAHAEARLGIVPQSAADAYKTQQKRAISMPPRSSAKRSAPARREYRW